MTNVHVLPGCSIQAPERVETTVELLTDMLERAEAGEIVGVVVVANHQDERASYAVAGRISSYITIGALDVAKTALVADQLSGD